MQELARKSEAQKSPETSLSFSYKPEKTVKPLTYTHSGFQIFRKTTCPCDGGCPRCAPIQTKLRIGEPDDEYEKEADRVAEQVMRMPDPVLQSKRNCPLIKDASCKEDEEEELKEKTLMKKESKAQVNAPHSYVPPIVHEVLHSPGQPLDVGTRAFFEPRFGYDFSNVKVHTDEKSAESAQAVNALAYTVGKDVIFGTGFYASGRNDSKKLLAHELAHVVQQNDASGTIMRSPNAQTVQAPTSVPVPEYTEANFSPSVSQSTVTQSIKPSEVAQSDVAELLKVEAKQDALRIKFIFQDNSWLGPVNQSDIMSIVEKWAAKTLDTGTRMTPFDYFIAAMRLTTFETGLVKQTTTPFDQIFHRMDSVNVERFKCLMQSNSRIFKDEKAIEMAKFEVKKEDVLDAVQLTAEVTAAFASGGGSVLFQIVTWLADKLPKIFQTVNVVFEFVNTIQNIKLDDIMQFFSPKGLGDLVVKVLFGEMQAFAVAERDDSEEMKDDKESKGGHNEKGLIKVFHIIMKIFNALKQVYDKVASIINKSMSAIDITKKSWFPKFSAIYAGIFKAMEAVSDPAVLLNQAVAEIKGMVSGFFGSIRTKVNENAKTVKSYIENTIGNPLSLMKTVADRAVEMVLNFIITSPPSKLVQVAFKAIERGSGKSIIELVREKIPIADIIITKISESSIVQSLIKPIGPAVSTVGKAIDGIAGEAGALIGKVEATALSFMGNGAQMIAELTGVNINLAAEPSNDKLENAKSGGAPSGSDFLGIVKQGIHNRLIAAGDANLLAYAKDLGMAALKKGISVAGAVAMRAGEILFGGKSEFEVNGEQHEIWAESEGEAVNIFVASGTAKNVVQLQNDYIEAFKKKEYTKFFTELDDVNAPSIIVKMKDDFVKVTNELKNAVNKGRHLSKDEKIKSAHRELLRKFSRIIVQIEREFVSVIGKNKINTLKLEESRKGGAYKDLEVQKGEERLHMPAQSKLPPGLKMNMAPAFVAPAKYHKLTADHGSGSGLDYTIHQARMNRDLEGFLIKEDQFEVAQDLCIEDFRSIAGSIYDKRIKAMLEYTIMIGLRKDYGEWLGILKV